MYKQFARQSTSHIRLRLHVPSTSQFFASFKVWLNAVLRRCLHLTLNKEASSRLYAELLCRRHAEEICRPPVESHPKSHSHVVRTSSACRLHIICTKFQPQKYFQLNSRATALLKIKGTGHKNDDFDSTCKQALKKGTN